MSKPKTKQELLDEAKRLNKRVAELESKLTECDSKLEVLLVCETRYRALFDNVDFPVTRLDRDGAILEANAAGAAVVKMTPDEVVGRSIFDLLPGASDERIQHSFESGETERHEFRMETPTSTHWFTSCYVPIKETDGTVCCLLLVSHDITGLKQTEEQQKLLSSIIRQSSEGVALVDMDGDIQYINDAFARMHGYQAEELVGKNLSVFHTEDQMSAVLMINDQIRKTGEFNGEVWHVHRDGNVFPTIMHNSLLYDDKGAPIRIVGTVRDITARKLAEAELRESNEKYRLLIDNIGCPILLYDKEGVLLLINDDGARILGGVPSDFVGKGLHDIYPESADRYMERSARVIESGKGEDHLDETDTPNGHRWFWSSGQPARKADGTIYGVQVVMRDVTKLKENEASLQAMAEELMVERGALHEKNIALKQVLDHMESQKQDWSQKLQVNLEQAITPFLDELAKLAGPKRASEFEELKSTLNVILATDTDDFSRRLGGMTVREMEVCEEIAKGRSSKEIAEDMNLSLLTVLKHREKIRKKLGLTGKRVVLGAYLRRYLESRHT